jgi:hypothetical protein
MDNLEEGANLFIVLGMLPWLLSKKERKMKKERDDDAHNSFQYSYMYMITVQF